MKVDEGEKYYLKDIRFVGNTQYSTDYLMAVLGMKPGEVYNQKKLNERLSTDDDAVSNVYFNNGYLFFNADPVEVDVANDSISLEIRIQEGPQATINVLSLMVMTVCMRISFAVSCVPSRVCCSAVMT